MLSTSQLIKILIIPALGLGLISCTSPGKKTAAGAGIGAGAGAAIGAIVGHQSGNRGKGALIGAAIGSIAGGSIGNRLDKQAKELEAVAETRRTENGIITKLKGDILFDSGSTALKPAAKNSIEKISNIVKKYAGNKITVMGHTDSQGSSALNQRLSETRANSVRAYMIANGVPAQAVHAVGLGENQPIAANDTAGGRAANRRVELDIKIVE